MAVTIERENGVAYITLDRADAGNRLNQAMVERLTELFNDPQDAVIVLQAAGEDFSLGRERPVEQSHDPLDIVEEFQRIQDLNERVQHCRAVTISVIHGRAEGAGLSLAARCDIALIANDARVSFPEIPHGIPPTIVLSHYRYVLPRNLLGDLIFAGRELIGQEAVSAGLAARCVAKAELVASATKLARDIASYDRRSIRLVKEFLHKTESLLPDAAPALGISLYANEMSHRFLSSQAKP